MQAHFNKDPRQLRQFGEQLNSRVIEVIDRACRRAGVNRADLAATHGHLGAADQLTALALHLERGQLSPGDLVALTGISIGMRWYCTLIRV